jgi:uncharacterized membrane protein (UPF0182 family)
VLALFVSAVLSSAWLTFARFLNQPQVAGPADPIFGRPLNFYLFTLPVLEVASAWLLLVSVAIAFAAVVVYGLGMSVRLRGMSLAGSLVLAAVALRLFLARYQLLLEDHSLFTGVQYVDDKVYAVAQLVTAITLLLAAGAMALNVSNRVRSAAAPLLLPVAVYLAGGMLIPRM